MSSDFEYIDENLKRIRYNIGEALSRSGRNAGDVRLMAVTKTVAPEAVNHAIDLGVGLLGENRVQEYLSKAEAYKSAEVHIIGHLQTNKVKYIVDRVSMIQSVDSLRLAGEIDRLAAKNGVVMDVLCEVNIGGEESKSGIAPDELGGLLDSISQLENIKVRGLMTIPPPSESDIFLGRMEELWNRIKSEDRPGISMDVLSMGMTGDYEAAIEHGSTIVRIGTGLFGARDYSKK